MSVITWPDFLPAPTFKGYEVQPQARTERTKMSSGYSRTRRRTFTPPTYIPHTWIFTAKQYGAFCWWVDNSLNGGATPWLGKVLTAKGLEEVECQFVEQQSGPYKAVPHSADCWEVTALIEVRQMPVGQLTDFWPDDVPTLDIDFLTQTYRVAG